MFLPTIQDGPIKILPHLRNCASLPFVEHHGDVTMTIFEAYGNSSYPIEKIQLGKGAKG